VAKDHNERWILQEENLESYEQENLLKIGNEFWQEPAREYLPEN
jgi:hypothetical protein